MTERIFIIACRTLALDIERITKEMGLAAGCRFLPGGLHENPARLRREVQAVIDEISSSQSKDWDRLVVGYGLCGRGTVGLRASTIPLAIPRVHDCIALFLGGNDVYQREFERYPGTYYISQGWYAEKTEPLAQKRSFVHLDGELLSYEALVERYGEKKARKTYDFLNSWQRNYQRAAFIDTGSGEGSACAAHARRMAAENGWKFETLPGDPGLLRRLVAARFTTEEILIVPAGYVTFFDSGQSRLRAGPPADSCRGEKRQPPLMEEDKKNTPGHRGRLRTGLGIDAGGTYTDAVVYDLETRRVLGKNKALTTKWDYTVGIKEALKGLDESLLARIELTALSTTLATNAIVEGDGQKVGLLLMPPFGLFDRGDIPHEPKAVIAGRMEITGRILADVDEEALRRTAREMVDRQGVTAFAVSGFAGSVNPEHELAVKRILREETGCFVSCGHELSDLLNFRTRAETAVQNARIVPRLMKLLGDLRAVLSSLGIDAPVAVVKGDGSLMSSEMALARPVETILSGPAASVAGARFLSQKTDAVVVDMGGTTTDTATLKDGLVKVTAAGSRVGGVRTHVRALEIRTTGLGGDSLISCENGRFAIGPRRVAPMALLGLHEPGPETALALVEAGIHRSGGSSKALQFFALNHASLELDLTEPEAQIVARLRQRPHALQELAEMLGAPHPSLVPLDRLREHHIVQCFGVTPTDLLHVEGAFTRWHAPTARRAVALLAKFAGQSTEEMVSRILDDISKRLAMELVKKQLDSEVESDSMDDCPVCRLLMENMLAGGNGEFRVGVRLNRPVIGIGAPIGFFLPRAAELLETEAILPEHADVANAVGAITSNVFIKRQLKIHPEQAGGFYLEGLSGGERFAGLAEAEAHARKALGELVRRLAAEAGTAETAVRIDAKDRTATLTGGDTIFLERILTATLSGPPDLPRLLPGQEKR